MSSNNPYLVRRRVPTVKAVSRGPPPGPYGYPQQPNVPPPTGSATPFGPFAAGEPHFGPFRAGGPTTARTCRRRPPSPAHPDAEERG